MNLRRCLTLVWIAGLLTACTATNVRDLEATGITATHADTRSWQDAYRLLNDRVRECIATQGIGAAITVDGQLYSDVGELIVRYPPHPFTSRNGYVARVQVHPADPGSKVTVQAVDNALGRSVAERVPKWLGGMQGCR